MPPGLLVRLVETFDRFPALSLLGHWSDEALSAYVDEWLDDELTPVAISSLRISQN